MEKQYKWFITFLLFSALAIYSCVVDDEIEIQKEPTFQTVELLKAQRIFNLKTNPASLNGIQTIQKTTNESLVEPDWETFSQQSLDFGKAMLANVKAKVNVQNKKKNTE